jgi:hypothetical protein
MPDETPDREPDDLDEDDDRPRRRRPRDDEDDDDFEDRPRRRRRRREDAGDEGLQFVIPVNTSGLAIAAGYVGLISVLCFPAPFAILLGVLALVHLKKNPKMHGKGRAIFALVMGVLFTLVPLVFLIVASLSGS